MGSLPGDIARSIVCFPASSSISLRPARFACASGATRASSYRVSILFPIATGLVVGDVVGQGPAQEQAVATMDIGVWLLSLGLGRYEAAFRDNSIDPDVLLDLTDSANVGSLCLAT